MNPRNGHAHANRPLAERLRKTLVAARGNMQIRQRLRGIVSDPERLDAIVRELGPGHALVRELIEVGSHGARKAGYAA